MERDERTERDEARQQLPFEGLHVYQRVQEAWAAAEAAAGAGPLRGDIEAEIRKAALGIARATARSRANGDFGAELEAARGALHAAAAVADQMARRGDPAQDEFRTLLVDSSRMLGALIRSVSRAPGDPLRGEAAEEAAA
ncbi:MAG: hypothetical protein H0W36_06695 [Gemmatimonadetes bacterium]|nr:hypothetical protein [Gemmatimonadota bacterium]